MKILVSYRGIPQSRGWATGDFVVEALRRLGHQVLPYGNYYQSAERLEGHDPEALRKQDYDLHVFMECNDADPQYRELAEVVEKRARVSVSWVFDTSYYRDHLVGLLRSFRFRHNFVANPKELRRFDFAHYLPYAADLTRHFVKALPNPKTGAALFGSVRPDRTALVEYAHARGLTIELNGGFFREEYVRAISQSRITVNQNPALGAGLLNMRTYEAPAAGSLLLMERRDYSLNPGQFERGKTCEVFRNRRELVAVCRELLGDLPQLDALRLAGQDETRRRHTYDHRCAELLEIVSA